MAQDPLMNLDLMMATTLIITAIYSTILFFREWRRQKRSENEQYIPYALMLLYLLLSVSASMIVYSNFFVSTEIHDLLIDTKIYYIGVVVTSVTKVVRFTAPAPESA